MTTPDYLFLHTSDGRPIQIMKDKIVRFWINKPDSNENKETCTIVDVTGQFTVVTETFREIHGLI